MAKKHDGFWQLISPSGIRNKGDYLKFLHRFRLLVILGLIASLGVFIAIAAFTGFYSVIESIKGASLYWYLLAFVCVFAGYCVRFWKWQYFTDKIRLKVSKKKNFLIYLSTNGMNITPGGIGSIVAAYTLKKLTGKPFTQIVPIVTIDLFTDYAGFALFALIFAIYINKYVPYVILIDAILVIPFALLIHPWLFNRLRERDHKNSFINWIMAHAKSYYMAQSALNKPKTYLTALVFTVPADLLNTSALFFTLLALGIRIQLIKSTFIFSVSQILGMISALPGGIGAAEISFVTLLKSDLGINYAAASAATIMTRFATLWFGVILGIIALIYTTRYWNATNK